MLGEAQETQFGVRVGMAMGCWSFSPIPTILEVEIWEYGKYAECCASYISGMHSTVLTCTHILIYYCLREVFLMLRF